MYESIDPLRQHIRPHAASSTAMHALLPFAMIAAIACSGCADDDAHRDDGSESRNAKNETAIESPDGGVHATRDDDAARLPVAADERDDEVATNSEWDAVSSVGTIRGTRVLMGLLRHLDVHHDGQPQTILVTWDESNYAIDEFGGRLPIFAEEWKGLIEAIVSRAQRDEGGISRWRAMPAQMYNDGYGEVTRHNYRVFIESNERIRLENDGPAH